MKNQDVSADGRILGPCRECGYLGPEQDPVTGELICDISGRDVSRLTGGCSVFKKRIKPAEEYNYYCGLESSLCKYRRPVAGVGWRDKATGPRPAATEKKCTNVEDCYIDRREKGIATMRNSEEEEVFTVPSWWGNEQLWALLDATNKSYEKGLVIGGIRKENEIKKALGIKP